MYEALLGGGVGGLVASALAHVVTTLFDGACKSGSWLQGRYGPPFFNISLFMGIMYGGIAFGLSKRRSDVAVGALGPFLGIALPLAALERMGIFDWYHLVIGIFVAATWGTIIALGWRLGRGWRGALGAIIGAFAGYLILTGIGAASPRLMAWPIPLYRYLPTPAVLLDGLLTGAGIGAGVFILRGKNGKRAGA